MEFRDIFFILIVPALSALISGLAVNFFLKTRFASRSKEYRKELDTLTGSGTEYDKRLQELQQISAARALILFRWQNEYIEPLQKIRHRLGLGTTIGFDDIARPIDQSDKKDLRRINEEIRELRAAKVQILPEVLLNLGTILYSVGEEEPAIQIFEEAINADPTAQDARSNLGAIYLNLGRPEDAVHEFGELVELARHRFDGQFGLGLGLLELGRYEEGITALSTAIRLKPDHGRSYCELGRAYMMTGEMDKAMESVQVALKVTPDIFEGKVLIQEILIKTGRFREAIDECRKFIAEKESDRIYYNMAIAYALDGDRESALRELRRALQLGDHLRFKAKDDQAFNILRDSQRFQNMLEGKPGLF